MSTQRRGPRGRRQREAVEHIAKLITARATLDELVEAVLAEAMSATSAENGLIALVDHNNGELIIRTTAGEGWTEEKRQKRLRIGANLHEGITGYVASHGEPRRTGDVSRDPHYVELFEGFRSELAAPMIARGERVIGVLDVESIRPNAFTAVHEQFVCGLAALCAVGLSQDAHHRRERALIETGHLLSSEPDVDSLLYQVTAAAAGVLEASDCSLFLLDEEGARLNLIASTGSLQDRVGEAHYHLGEGLTGWIAERGEVVNLPDAAEHPHWLGKYQETTVEGSPFIGVPIKGSGRVEGVLRAVRRNALRALPNPFQPEELEVLATIAGQIAVGIQRARMLDRLVETERMAALGEMSARAAHMIGNKAFAMKGHLGELRHLAQQGGSPAECEGALARSERSLQEIEEIIQEFKDLVTAPQLQLAPQDVNDLLDTAVRLALQEAPRIRAAFDLAPDLPPVLGDATRLQACFAELAQNAVTWQPEAGELTVTTKLAEPETLRRVAGLRGPGPFVEVDFRDAGPGIPADRKEQIFRPFHSTHGRGMGLGLAICREVLQAHGGQIVEIGAVDEGAHFVLLLPVADSKERTEDVQHPRS